MSRTKHHGSKGRPSNTCPSGRKCPTCAENRKHAGEKDRKEAEMKLNEEITDYDRINPVCIMLSDCDLAIIETAKTEGQDVRDFLQCMISEDLRVIRDRGGEK